MCWKPFTAQPGFALGCGTAPGWMRPDYRAYRRSKAYSSAPDSCKLFWDRPMSSRSTVRLSASFKKAGPSSSRRVPVICPKRTVQSNRAC
ncbi:hypothetical protein D3C75_1115750 [compost metagenome]